METGTIVFLMSNENTKSMAVLPYLYQSREKCFRVWVDGDNPFENKLLLPFDGQKVEIEGEMDDYDVFVIQTIKRYEAVDASLEAPQLINGIKIVPLKDEENEPKDE